MPRTEAESAGQPMWASLRRVDVVEVLAPVVGLDLLYLALALHHHSGLARRRLARVCSREYAMRNRVPADSRTAGFRAGCDCRGATRAGYTPGRLSGSVYSTSLSVRPSASGTRFLAPHA